MLLLTTFAAIFFAFLAYAGGDWAVGLPVLFVFAVTAAFLAIHPASRPVAFVSLMIGIGSCCVVWVWILQRSGPINESFIISVVLFELFVSVVGIPFCLVVGILSIVLARRRKQ